jgi:hypothetical protein
MILKQISKGDNHYIRKQQPSNMKLVLNCAQCKLHSENVIKITNFKGMGDIYVALRLKSLQQKLYGHHHDLVDRLFHQSLVAIGPVVSEEKIKM